MSYRRTVIGLLLLVGLGLAGRVPGQAPTQPIPTARQPVPTRSAQIPADQGPFDLPGIAGDLECPQPGLPPLGVPSLGVPPLGVPNFSVPPPDGGLVPGPGDEDCNGIADPPAPQVRIKVRVPSVAPSGKELEYKLIVENTGRGAAHRTMVRVTLPASVRVVRAVPEPTTLDPEPRWGLGTLPPCGTREISLIVIPGDEDVRLCARVMHEYGQCVLTRMANKPAGTDIRVVPVPIPETRPRPLPQPPTPQPQPPQPPPQTGNPNLTLKVTAPATTLLFDMPIFLIDIANTGTGPARDVTVIATPEPGLDLSNAQPAESRSDPLTWTFKSIGPGQRQRVELRMIAKKIGPLGLTAELDSGGQKKTERGQVLVQEVKLGLVKLGPKQRLIGSPAVYHIEVINLGEIPAANVVITDEIPDQIEFVEASAPGKLVGTAVRWEVGTLAPKERKRVQLVIRSKAAGTLKNRAKAQTDRMEKGVTAEAETLFENVTGLTVEIDREFPQIEVGAMNRYLVRVVNQGDGDVENLGVTIALPMELTLVDAKGPPGTAEALRNAGLVTFPPMIKLPGKQKAEFLIRATAAMPGEIKVKVEVIAKQLTGPVRVEEGTTILPGR